MVSVVLAVVMKKTWERSKGTSTVLVIGSEGRGVSRLTKNACDFIVKIPMRGKVNSLNASNAAAILAYEVLKQRTLK